MTEPWERSLRLEACRLQREVERLQKEVKELSAGTDYYEEVLMLRADNMRLRNALMMVANQAAGIRDFFTGGEGA